MPSYDYECKACKTITTIEKSMNDPAEPPCSNCGSKDVQRIWTLFMKTSGTPDVGQGMATATAPRKKTGCGSCSSHSCSTC